MRGLGSSRGDRNNRDWNSKPEHSQQQNGPLMSNHLRDIEIEMEILKRKREMIQQEHALLDREREFNLKRQYEYEQPSVSYSQPISSGYESTYYRQPGNKRQAVEKSPPKRFNPPHRVEPWEQNINTPPRPRNNNFNYKPQPLLNVAPKTRPARSMPSVRKDFRPTKPEPVVRKDFNPTKITKPRSRTSYLQKPPTTPRATTLQSNQSELVVDPDFVLRHDVAPSPQLNGRLELALGSILKELKQQTQEEPKLGIPSMAHTIQRIIKQIIRERIRAVMMNKFVGHLPDILACYRKKYPVETDAELLELATQAQKYQIHILGIPSLINSEQIKDYFQAKLTELVGLQLNQVFNRMKDVYKTDGLDDKILKEMDNVIDLKTTTEINDGENICKTDESKNKEENDKNENSAVEDTEECKTIKRIAKSKAYLDLMEDLLKKKLPELLPKFKDMFVSMLNADKEFEASKSVLLEETIKHSVSLVEKKAANKQPKANQIVKKVSIEKGLSEAADSEKNKSITQDQVEATMKKESPPVVTNTTPKSANQTPVSKIIEYPYYVKLIGRPELPSRAAVYEYLQQFKPASIKKHKTIGNLLVLGFNDKEGYDKILEADETTIGQNTIIIKANENINITPHKPSPKKNDEENTTNVETPAEESVKTEEPQEESNLNDSLTISPELDDQITNLLSAIRAADEIKTIETPENEAEKEPMDTEKETPENEAEKETPENESEKDPINTENPDIEPEVAKDDSSNIAEPMETNSEVNEKATDNNLNEDNKNIDSDEKQNQDQKETDTNNKVSDNVDTESSNAPENNDKDEESTSKAEDKDVISNLKTTGRSTPTRASSRLATVTPSSIKTRRASRLAQNN